MLEYEFPFRVFHQNIPFLNYADRVCRHQAFCCGQKKRGEGGGSVDILAIVVGQLKNNKKILFKGFTKTGNNLLYEFKKNLFYPNTQLPKY